jgi:S1/P1 Nuclease
MCAPPLTAAARPRDVTTPARSHALALLQLSMRSSPLIAVVAVGLAVVSSRARAWDDFGHMQVAAVAYDKLTPQAKKRATALLALNPSYGNWVSGAKKSARDRIAFLRAATWADAIKNDAAFSDKNDDQKAATAGQNLGYRDKLRHRYWHFIDVPISADGAATEPALAPNAQTQIAAFRSTLADPAASDDLKSYDLSWLLHLVGDIHQPLHCTSRFDKAQPQGDQGGNKVMINGNTAPAICDDPRFCPYGPPNELHAFFDDLTGSSYSIAEVSESLGSLPKPARTHVAISDEARWVEEGVETARTGVYVAPVGVGPGPFTLDAAYQKAALQLARQRVALAGARLAELLNAAFATEAANGAAKTAAR